MRGVFVSKPDRAGNVNVSEVEECEAALDQGMHGVHVLGKHLVLPGNSVTVSPVKGVKITVEVVPST